MNLEALLKLIHSLERSPRYSIENMYYNASLRDLISVISKEWK